MKYYQTWPWSYNLSLRTNLFSQLKKKVKTFSGLKKGHILKNVTLQDLNKGFQYLESKNNFPDQNTIKNQMLYFNGQNLENKCSQSKAICTIDYVAINNCQANVFPSYESFNEERQNIYLFIIYLA